MATTVPGLIRSIFSAGGITYPITADEPSSKRPGGTTFPYITIADGISTSRLDTSAPGFIERAEIVQIDVWQKRTSAAEDSTLPLTLERLLEAATLTALSGGAGTVYRLRVLGGRRMFEPDTRIVHHALNVVATRRI